MVKRVTLTMVIHGGLCYSMFSFCLAHAWSCYIIVHDYGLTWLSMLFHVLPRLLPWTWLIILYHGIFFTWSTMENYCLLLPDHFNIRPQLTMIKSGHCVHCFYMVDHVATLVIWTMVNRRIKVVYKSRQPAKFTGFSKRFCRLLSLLQESRYGKEMIGSLISRSSRLPKKSQK